MTEIYDAENPEWQEADFKKARPASEMFPHLVKQRGKQKKATKEPVSIRLSPEVLAFFRAQGKGWQTRLDHVLQEHVASHQS